MMKIDRRAMLGAAGLAVATAGARAEEAQKPAPAAAPPDLSPTEMRRARAVCQCKAVSVGMIEDAVAIGHTTRETVAKATRASTGCGGCAPWVEQTIAAALTPATEAA